MGQHLKETPLARLLPRLSALRLAALGWLAALLLAFAPAPASAQWRDSWLPPNWRDDFGSGERDLRRDRAARMRLYEQLDAQLVFAEELISESTLQAVEGAIARYRRIVARGGWVRIPKTKGRWLRRGVRDQRVALLARRLAASGDLKPGRRITWTFDRNLEAALKRFQRRHGLRPNGVVDTRTLAVLNVPAEERLAQLQVNRLRIETFLEKVREAERYVVVNVPAFQLQAVRAGRVEIVSKVIAGRPKTQTPTVVTKIRGLNFYPYWRVPDSIARRDLIPTILKDPDYLRRERIRVLDRWGGEELDPATIDWRSPAALKLKFRQDRGEFNALGVVRIDMPNEHIVYLHDTPLKKLFGRSGRAFSAGCVRVQRIIDLVTWLLEGDKPEEWNRARIDSILMAREPLDVKLARPVPVLFVYITAWAGDDGTVYFRPDLYGRDGVSAMLAEYSEERPPVQSLAP